MAKELSAQVEITSREETVCSEVPGGPKLATVLIHRAFSGDLEGTSVANLVLCQGDDGGGYTSQERFTGSIDGRSGTVVFHHGRISGGDAPMAFGQITPNSGTGDLSGIAGFVTFGFSPSGGTVALTINE